MRKHRWFSSIGLLLLACYSAERVAIATESTPLSIIVLPIRAHGSDIKIPHNILVQADEKLLTKLSDRGSYDFRVGTGLYSSSANIAKEMSGTELCIEIVNEHALWREVDRIVCPLVKSKMVGNAERDRHGTIYDIKKGTLTVSFIARVIESKSKTVIDTYPGQGEATIQNSLFSAAVRQTLYSYGTNSVGFEVAAEQALQNALDNLDIDLF